MWREGLRSTMSVSAPFVWRCPSGSAITFAEILSHLRPNIASSARNKRWPIDRLIPYAKNSRTHSEAQIAQLAASMKKSETGHGTQKPVECMRRPIENDSSRGQVVYDPFC